MTEGISTEVPLSAEEIRGRGKDPTTTPAGGKRKRGEGGSKGRSPRPVFLFGGKRQTVALVEREKKRKKEWLNSLLSRKRKKTRRGKEKKAFLSGHKQEREGNWRDGPFSQKREGKGRKKGRGGNFMLSFFLKGRKKEKKGKRQACLISWLLETSTKKGNNPYSGRRGGREKKENFCARSLFVKHPPTKPPKEMKTKQKNATRYPQKDQGSFGGRREKEKKKKKKKEVSSPSSTTKRKKKREEGRRFSGSVESTSGAKGKKRKQQGPHLARTSNKEQKRRLTSVTLL